MTSLFLLLSGWDEDPSLADRVVKQSRDGEAIVLPLDFWAGAALRRASIRYETPDSYFDPGRGRDLDATATRLARSWHEALGGRLQHAGIPLAEMAEYDFAFLFIDALRSAEIAGHLFEVHGVEEVHLCRPAVLRSPNAIRHEALPKVVDYQARQRGVPVVWSGPERSGMHTASGRDRLRDALFNDATNARTLFHSLRRQEGVLFVRIPGYPRIGSTLEATGLSSLGMLPPRRALRKGRRLAHTLEGLWKGLRGDLEFQEALAYRDIPLAGILNDRFEQFFREGVPELIALIEGAEWLIRRLRPRILVLAVDVTPETRTLARVFVRNGLPVLVLQHGTVSVDMGGVHVMPVEADRQAVWGSVPREWHLARGMAPESQVVTGNPAFDPIADGWPVHREEVLGRLGLRPGDGIILLATEWLSGTSTTVTGEAEERFIRSTLQAVRGFPDHRLIVKLHPGYQNEYEPLVRSIATEESLSVTIANEDLWDFLAVSDVVIISNSTVGLEAMILGKPVVVVHAFEGMEEVPYVASGAALGALPEPEAIAAAVGKALRDEETRDQLRGAREAFVHAYASERDGRASERVAQLIEEMIGRSPA